jgi:UDP-3-O-[3-hydroxymyristoyl] N-acetylglucosamine deacetylase
LTDTDSQTASEDSAGGPRQRTLKHSIHCSGVSVHHGCRVNLTLHPAEPDSGISFRRTDIAGRSALIPATWRNVAEAPMCTTLRGADGVTLATVEHLLAALYGCEIDNALIEVSGPELPIMDGSAWPFVFLIECAGVVAQAAPRRFVEVLRPVRVGNGERWAELVPASALSLAVEIRYDSPAIARQHYALDLEAEVFKAEVSRARTYGFLHEVDQLRAAGLARGASLDNAIVVTGSGIMNEGGLRYRDEFARHKVLDAIGDLSLAGARILGGYRAYCTGHRLNHELLATLFATPDAWRMATAAEAAARPAPVERRAAAG